MKQTGQADRDMSGPIPTYPDPVAGSDAFTGQRLILR
jgi:hypothetical protein